MKNRFKNILPAFLACALLAVTGCSCARQDFSPVKLTEDGAKGTTTRFAEEPEGEEMQVPSGPADLKTDVVPTMAKQYAGKPETVAREADSLTGTITDRAEDNGARELTGGQKAQPVLEKDFENSVGRAIIVDEAKDKAAKKERERKTKPFWVVEKFTEKKDWLDAHPSLVTAERQWGNELTQAVRKALTKHSLTVESIGKKLTEEQVERLADEGMKYLCGGSLESLTETETDDKPTAKLSLVYELKRSSAGQVRLVQKERLSFSAGITGQTITEADLQGLIEQAADAIAGRIVEHIPSDLTAARG